MAHANIVSPEAVNFLTTKVYAEVDETWLPHDFIVAQPARNHDGTTIGDIDVEHFCAPVVHPVTGEKNFLRQYHQWWCRRDYAVLAARQ